MIVFKEPGLRLNWSSNMNLHRYNLMLSDEMKYLEIYIDKYYPGPIGNSYRPQSFCL